MNLTYPPQEEKWKAVKSLYIQYKNKLALKKALGILPITDVAAPSFSDDIKGNTREASWDIGPSSTIETEKPLTAQEIDEATNKWKYLCKENTRLKKVTTFWGQPMTETTDIMKTLSDIALSTECSLEELTRSFIKADIFTNNIEKSKVGRPLFPISNPRELTENDWKKLYTGPAKRDAQILGPEPMERSVAQFKALSDIAATTGQSLQEVTTAFTKLNQQFINNPLETVKQLEGIKPKPVSERQILFDPK